MHHGLVTLLILVSFVRKGLTALLRHLKSIQELQFERIHMFVNFILFLDS